MLYLPDYQHCLDLPFDLDCAHVDVVDDSVHGRKGGVDFVISKLASMDEIVPRMVGFVQELSHLQAVTVP